MARLQLLLLLLAAVATATNRMRHDSRQLKRNMFGGDDEKHCDGSVACKKDQWCEVNGMFSSNKCFDCPTGTGNNGQKPGSRTSGGRSGSCCGEGNAGSTNACRATENDRCAWEKIHGIFDEDARKASEQRIAIEKKCYGDAVPWAGWDKKYTDKVTLESVGKKKCDSRSTDVDSPQNSAISKRFDDEPLTAWPEERIWGQFQQGDGLSKAFAKENFHKVGTREKGWRDDWVGFGNLADLGRFKATAVTQWCVSQKGKTLMLKLVIGTIGAHHCVNVVEFEEKDRGDQGTGMVVIEQGGNYGASRRDQDGGCVYKYWSAMARFYAYRVDQNDVNSGDDMRLGKWLQENNLHGDSEVVSGAFSIYTPRQEIAHWPYRRSVTPTSGAKAFELVLKEGLMPNTYDYKGNEILYGFFAQGKSIDIAGIRKWVTEYANRYPGYEAQGEQTNCQRFSTVFYNALTGKETERKDDTLLRAI